MVVRSPQGGSKTIEDWMTLPDDARIELIDGEFVQKAAPTFEHGRAQLHTGHLLAGPFDRPPGGPGGWWFASEVDLLLDGRIYRPDIAGWRRERVAAPLKERPVSVRPDWICEIVSDSNRTTDTVIKLRRYHRAACRIPGSSINSTHLSRCTATRVTATSSRCAPPRVKRYERSRSAQSSSAYRRCSASKKSEPRRGEEN